MFSADETVFTLRLDDVFFCTSKINQSLNTKCLFFQQKKKTVQRREEKKGRTGPENKREAQKNAEQYRAEQYRAEQYRTEQYRTEQSRAEQRRRECSGQTRTENHKVQNGGKTERTEQTRAEQKVWVLL